MNRFDEEEKGLLESFEKGEWQSVNDEERVKTLQGYARAMMSENQQVTLNLSSVDLGAIKAIALKEGISYENLISNILHDYVNGQLAELKK
ncbi:antitoxin [Cyanobacterium stanieri LEGE 03274]|uniref:Antitoxin n=1 Tax=Cyanobacterium stanieri LEGE 03274 TaxID=1828756 RepID=A0ABR9V7H5_9CHRO|nr:antitoxin [Cyanobacterium stanieri]MBE9223857.1 antitoxin [Cyanobacterium stanieri LEGE 03274]